MVPPNRQMYKKGASTELFSYRHTTRREMAAVQVSARRPRVALVTGITGQDGSYLAEFLLEKGYIVHGAALVSPLSRSSVELVAFPRS